MPARKSTPPDPPPWGLLIARARAARGLSPEQAVERLLIALTGSRWRQVEAGYVLRKRGEWIKTGWNDDDTIAHMAWAVGVAPEQLTDIGRAEAGEIVREIRRQNPKSSELAPEIEAAAERLIARIKQMKAGQVRRVEQIIDLVDGEAS